MEAREARQVGWLACSTVRSLRPAGSPLGGRPGTYFDLIGLPHDPANPKAEHQYLAADITHVGINNLSGEAKALSQQHADNSARLANATQPEYLVTLVVSFPTGEERLRTGFPGWEPLGQHELFVEMERFLSGLDLERTLFRSDHASNWLILKGTLGADKERPLQQVRQAIAAPEAVPLRPAWARGL